MVEFAVSDCGKGHRRGSKHPDEGKDSERRNWPAPGTHRNNPLRPPVEAEILFVLPSISMSLTSDQRQSMARPTPHEMSVFVQAVQAQKLSTSTFKTTSSLRRRSPPANNGKTGASLATAASTNASGGDRQQAAHSSKMEEEEKEGARVHLSFQTDFHGVIQLGLIDVPWLPSLISSYISEQVHEYESRFRSHFVCLSSKY